MTTKEFLKLMDRAKKEAAEMYKATGNNFTLKEVDIIVNRARQEKDLQYQKKLNKIREKAFELNKETGFYGICDMDFDTFEKCMGEYTDSDQMVIAYHLLQHARILDNMIFDEEGEE